MINPMQFAQTIRNGKNPQQLVANMLKTQSGNNPFVNNVIGMMEKRDSAGLEKLARNLYQEKGINPDDMYSQIKNQFGIK